MTAPGDQGTSSGYGLAYWLFYFFRRWLLTLWSIGLVLGAPFDAWFTTPVFLTAPFDAWFTTPVFLAALLFDLLLTPRALDLRISILDLEREIEADRPLAAVLEDWPMPERRWRSLWMFMWLTLVYLAILVALFVAAPAAFPRWGYMNFVSYTFCGTAIGSIFLVPIGLSTMSMKYNCTFRQYVNEVHAQSTRYFSLTKIFPGRLRFRIATIYCIILTLLIWFLVLSVYGKILEKNANEFDYSEYFLIFLGPMLPLLLNVFVPGIYWQRKIVLSLRKTDPLAGRYGKEIPRDPLFLAQDQSGEATGSKGRARIIALILLALVPTVVMGIYLLLFVDFGYLKCTGRRAIEPDVRIGYCTRYMESYALSDEKLINTYLFYDVTDYAEALRNRGIAYAEKGDGARAIQDHDEAIRLFPDNANLYNSRCWVNGLIRRPKDALIDCNESLRLRPDDAATLDSRALAYWLLNENEKARQDLERARQFDRTMPKWEERLREFEEMF